MKLGFESAIDKRALKRNTSGFFLKQIAQNGLRSTTYRYLTSKTHKRFLLLHLFFPFLFFFFFFLFFLTCMCGMKPSLTSMMLSSLMKSLTETRKFGYNISHIYQDLNNIWCWFHFSEKNEKLKTNSILLDMVAQFYKAKKYKLNCKIEEFKDYFLDLHYWFLVPHKILAWAESILLIQLTITHYMLFFIQISGKRGDIHASWNVT